MKFISSTIFIALVLCSFIAHAQNNYSDSLHRERQEFEDSLLKTDYLLNKMERAGIKAIDYFPVDTSWVIEGHLIKDSGKAFEMPTSTERKPKYKRYGWLCLKHGDRTFRLAAYQNLELKGKEYRNYLFVPFKDANAPELTYGGGRYLELHRERGSKAITVDFNAAFNPYCVYSHRFSCPITPAVNHLDFPIEAGEKNPVLKKSDNR